MSFQKDLSTQNILNQIQGARMQNTSDVHQGKDKQNHVDVLLIVAALLSSCTNSLQDSTINRAKGLEGLADKEKNLAEKTMAVNLGTMPPLIRDGYWENPNPLCFKHWYDVFTFLDPCKMVAYCKTRGSIQEALNNWQNGGCKSSDVWINKEEGKIYVTVGGTTYRVPIRDGENASDVANAMDPCTADLGRQFEQFYGTDNSAEVQQAYLSNCMQQGARQTFQGEFQTFNNMSNQENARLSTTAEFASTNLSEINSCLQMATDLMKKISPQ